MYRVLNFAINLLSLGIAGRTCSPNLHYTVQVIPFCDGLSDSQVWESMRYIRQNFPFGSVSKLNSVSSQFRNLLEARDQPLSALTLSDSEKKNLDLLSILETSLVKERITDLLMPELLFVLLKSGLIEVLKGVPFDYKHLLSYIANAFPSSFSIATIHNDDPDPSLYVPLATRKLKEIQEPLAWKYFSCTIKERVSKANAIQEFNEQKDAERKIKNSSATEKLMSRVFKLGLYIQSEMCERIARATIDKQSPKSKFVTIHHLDPSRLLENFCSFIRKDKLWMTCRVKVYSPGSCEEVFYRLRPCKHLVLAIDLRESMSSACLLAAYTKFGVTQYLDGYMSEKEIWQLITDPEVVRLSMVKCTGADFTDSELELFF